MLKKQDTKFGLENGLLLQMIALIGYQDSIMEIMIILSASKLFVLILIWDKNSKQIQQLILILLEQMEKVMVQYVMSMILFILEIDT
jgi:hypothetical protein